MRGVEDQPHRPCLALICGDDEAFFRGNVSLLFDFPGRALHVHGENFTQSIDAIDSAPSPVDRRKSVE